MSKSSDGGDRAAIARRAAQVLEDEVGHAVLWFDGDGNSLVRSCSACGGVERLPMPTPASVALGAVPGEFDDLLVQWIKKFNADHAHCGQN